MAESNKQLTGEDLARPAIHLPLKVLRELGRKLHRQLPTSGNWETLAEDLGYGFEDIHQFASLANVGQHTTPGESMLLNWVQRSHGCTLFVLRSALVKADRQDCVEYLEKEIYDKVICMDLLFCVKDETTNLTEHGSVRTRGNASLIGSLQGALEEPITDKYSLLDRNASWVKTMAKEYKGRELMLVKKTIELPMEQDPTVDSSNPTLGSSSTLDINSFVRLSTQQPSISGSTQTLIRSSQNIERGLAQNDLGQNSPEGQNSAGKTFPMNIQTADRKTINSTNNVQLEIPSGKGCFSSCNTIYSDESNMSYPTSVPENVHDIGTHEASGIQLEGDQYVDDFDDVNYQDSSEAVFNSIMDKSVNACTTQPYDSLESSWHVRANVGSVETTDTTMLDMNQKDNGGDNDDDNADMMKATSAEYEDPNGLHPEFITEDDPIYNFARETSLEMDDSLTLVKELANKNYNTKHDTKDFTSSQQTLTQIDHISSHVMHETQTDYDKGEEMGVYNSYRMNKHSYQFTGDPVYNDNCTKVYNDFSNVTNEGNTELQYSTHLATTQPVNETSNAQKTISTDLGLTARCDRLTNLESEPGVACTGEIKDASSFSEDRTGKNQDNMYGFHPNVPGPGHKGSEQMKVSVQSMQRDCCLQDKKNDINTQDCAYIDFNNYPQNDDEGRNVDERKSKSHDCAFYSKTEGMYNKHVFHVEQANEIQVDTTNGSNKKVRFANRCSSQIETRSSQYETLNRQTSCPNFEYSSSVIKGPLTTQFSTIAEAFSSTDDDSAVNELPESDIDRVSHLQDHCDLLNYKTDKQIHGKRNSYPVCVSVAQKEQIKFARHSLPRLNSKWSSGDADRSRPLPSLPGCENQRGRALAHSISSPSMASSQRESFNDRYRVVIGGKTSRPMLDGFLADDKLFMHYNSELCGYNGWSPREYEYTIDKTMGDVKHENGLYILWYHRTKKNLIITVTHAGGLLHYRVRTKVLDKRLFFYVSHSVMLPQVKQLLQYHHDNGLHVTEQQTVFMKLPVSVEYERTPVSV